MPLVFLKLGWVFAVPDASQVDDTVEFISEPSRTAVTVLTEEHLKSGQFTIHDVVLPLPGYDVVYPDNEFKEHYRQIMANDGLDIDNMRRKVRDYALSGAYRYVCLNSNVYSEKKLSLSMYQNVEREARKRATGKMAVRKI